MLSPIAVKIMNILPYSLVLKLGKKIINGYINKNANIKVEGFEQIDNVKKPIIFVCNHLSNSDGVILSNILKEKYDPYFVAGVKLDKDPITRVGLDLIKHIPIKPDSADKDAINRIIKEVRSGENLFIFPEGTRSRTASLIEAKRGILLMVRLTKATIVPIGLSGTDKLLPVAKDGNMGGETWHHADVSVKFGAPVELPKKTKEETKHEYDERCLTVIMKGIAALLPESYRGVYK